MLLGPLHKPKHLPGQPHNILVPSMYPRLQILQKLVFVDLLVFGVEGQLGLQLSLLGLVEGDEVVGADVVEELVQDVRGGVEK
jgi:hypothetical protein